MKELHLRVQDAAVFADRVDGQSRVVRGYLEGLPRHSGQLEGPIDPSRSHDDLRRRFTGLASLIGDRGWRAEGSGGRGPDGRQTRVRVDPTEESIERTRQFDIPVSGRFLGHWGPPEAPALGGLRNLRRRLRLHRLPRPWVRLRLPRLRQTSLR